MLAIIFNIGTRAATEQRIYAEDTDHLLFLSSARGRY
jgi:hypothetical protein